MDQDSKATISLGAMSSGYSSESAHTLNQTMNRPSNENFYANPEEHQLHRYSNIINNYEDESNENNKGYSTYITDSHQQEHPNQDEYQKNDDEMQAHHGFSDHYETEKLSSPLINDEKLVREVLAKAGPANTYMRAEYKNDIGSLGNQVHNDLNNLNLEEPVEHEYDENGEVTNPQFYNSSSSINQDPSPLRITKQNQQQNVIYKQQVNIRYLQPPTPPPPAPIIIREKQAPAPQRQPPIIIRQTAPAPATPPPLIIRERAPTPPEQTDPTVIEVKLYLFVPKIGE